MGTLAHELLYSDGWTEVVDSTDETFRVENRGKTPIHLTYSASAPAAAAPYHEVSPGASEIRFGTGKVYIRNSTNAARSYVVVSK